MGRYNGYTYVKQNLLDVPGTKAFGAFADEGGITPGFAAVNSYRTPISGLSAMIYSEGDGQVLAGTSGGGIYSGTDGTLLTLRYSDGGNPFAFYFTQKDRSGAALISGGTFTTLSNGVVEHGSFPYSLCCGAMRCGRLFGGDSSDGNLLRWSGEDGFHDWDEGISGAGSVVLDCADGSILDMFDFDEQLIIFRERAIVKFAASGNPENFRVAATVGVPAVSRNTIAKMGTCILFFTPSGLMRYRNGSAEIVKCSITYDLKDATFAHACLNRFYFVCGTSKSLGKKLVYVYDGIADRCQIIDFPAYFIASDGTSVLLYTETGIYRANYGSTAVEYSVETGTFDFGTPKRKLLTVLEMDCGDEVVVKISNGRYTRTVRSPDGRTRLNMRGSEFKVTFSALTGSVRSANLTAEVIK